MLQIEIFEDRNRSLLLCGGFPVCQRYTRRQKSLLYSFPLSPSSSGQGRHPFKVDIAGSNPAGGTTAFEQVKACFSSWPVFVSAHVRQARAPNQPKTAPAIHRGATGRTPTSTGSGPAASLSVFPFGPSATVLLGPLLPVCLPVCLALCYPFVCPFAWPFARPSATPRALGLGYPLATPRRAPLPVRSATPRPIAADRRARVQITPSERRTAPRNGPPLGARYSLMR